ncbi:MAG: DUF3299 domain-containing protein [Pirellulaceae bacterium]
MRFGLVAVACALAGCGGDSAPPTAIVITQPEKTPTTKTVPQPLREPIEVDWKRLEMPLGEDNQFEAWMVPPCVRELEGKRVRVKGLIYAGGLSQRGNIREFPLIREFGCQFGNGAPAWHIIMVELEGKLRTEYKTELITVEGILQVKPYNGPDGKTWSVYFLQGTKVE